MGDFARWITERHSWATQCTFEVAEMNHYADAWSGRCDADSCTRVNLNLEIELDLLAYQA